MTIKQSHREHNHTLINKSNNYLIVCFRQLCNSHGFLGKVI